MAYYVRVLGGLQVLHDDVSLGWVPAQRIRTALLVFLAVERQATRAHLSHLLWPDEEPDHARHALSQTLYLLRHALGEGVIEARGETVRISDDVRCDAVGFAAVTGCLEAAGALELYRGAFLAGITLSESREYEAWIDQQRARLARLHRKLRRSCLEELAAAGRTQDALEAARSWVLAEPFDDEAQHRLIELLAASGQRTEALQQYDAYLRLLEGEELEPLEETRALVVHLRAGAGDPAHASLPPMALGSATPAPSLDSQDAAAVAAHQQALSPPRPLRRALAGVLLAVSLAAVWWVGAGPQPAGRVRLAVLPFENVNGRAEDRYLVDGLTEGVTANLGMLEDLQVLSGVSSGGTPPNGRSPGGPAPVGATHVVHGTVEVAGGQVRIATRTLRADSGQVVFAREYRATTTELFRLDDVISRDVAGALDVPVSRAVRARIARQPTSSIRAYELYQRGRFLLNQWSREGLDSAIAVLEQAVEEDFFFAAARAELANAYNEKADLFAPGDSLRERAFVAIQTALLLDPDLAEAHIAYGNMLWTEEYNFPHRAALDAFLRAAELQPSSSTAHDRLSLVYVHIGLLDLALREARLAVELNPGDYLARFRVGLTLATQRRYAEALRELRNFPPSVAPVLRLPLIGEALFYLGRPDEALAVLDSADAAQPHDPWILSARALVRAERGDTVGALRDIEATLPLLPDRMHAHHGDFNVGVAYAALGRRELALARLERAVGNGWPCYPRFAADPVLARTLAGDPGYEAMMTGLKADWEGYRRDYDSAR